MFITFLSVNLYPTEAKEKGRRVNQHTLAPCRIACIVEPASGFVNGQYTQKTKRGLTLPGDGDNIPFNKARVFWMKPFALFFYRKTLKGA